MQKITPFLWFDGKAEEAAKFYVSIFENFALNGGPQYEFTPAISMFVSCETQAEVDYFWERLGVGGATNQCGWLTDRYGLSWQIVPSILHELLQAPDRAKAQRAMNAMLKMTKLDIQGLQRAFDGE